MASEMIRQLMDRPSDNDRSMVTQPYCQVTLPHYEALGADYSGQYRLLISCPTRRAPRDCPGTVAFPLTETRCKNYRRA